MLPAVLGGGEKIFDHVTGAKPAAKPAPTAELVTNSMPAEPTAEPQVVHEYRSKVHKKEDVETVTNLMQNFNTANNKAVLDYINGNKNANLTDEQKALLDDPKNAELVKKDIETHRNQYLQKLEKDASFAKLSAQEKQAMV